MIADLLLYNLTSLAETGSAAAPELIAIRQDRIVYAGSKDAWDDWHGSRTRVIDCQGGLVLPGFNDAHCHPIAFAVTQRYLDCAARSIRCIGDIQASLRQHAEAAPPQRWLRGANLDASQLGEQRLPNRWELDEAVPHLPVILVTRSGQQCVLNSMALAHCGISELSRAAEGESFERSPINGKLNGLVSGNSARIARAIPPLADDEIEAGLRQANQTYLAHGITSLQDTSWTNAHTHWQSLRTIKQHGLLAPRLTMLAGYDALAEFVEHGLSTGSGDANLRLGAMKIALDESSGSALPPQDELNQAALRAHRAGFQLAFHVPDVAWLQSSLRALRHLHNMVPLGPRRPRFEHCPVCPPALWVELAQSGAVIVSQPNLLFQTGPDYLRHLSDEQLKWVFPYRSALQHGVPLSFSSDSPLTPCRPLQAIQTTVTRRVAGGSTLVKEEQLTLAEAFAAYTSGGAYAAGDEMEKGLLAVGQLADLAVLNIPGTAAPERLFEAEVMLTLIDGQVAWER